MRYRAILDNIINEAKSERARGAILAALGNRLEEKLKSGTDAISKKYHDDVPGFLLWIESCDPTPKSLYTDWLIRLFLSGAFRYAEDIGKATDLLARYEELKPKLPQKERDIGFFKSFHIFHDFIDDHSETDTRSESQKDREIEQEFFSSGGAVLHYDSPEIKIVIPKTMKAAQWFGKNTRWCTSAMSNNAFHSYASDGPLYIVLFKKTNTRWQFHFESDQFMDEIDDELYEDQIKSIIHLFPTLPIEKNGNLIRFIDNPSEDVQLKAIKEDAFSICHIRNPTEAVKLAALRCEGGCIKFIENPSPEMKLAAVRQNGSAIRFIVNPSKELQLTAIQNSSGYAIEYIKNPSEAIRLAAIQKNGNVIHLINPNEEEKLAAVKQNGQAIKHIDNPSEEIKLAAVRQFGHAIRYIANPSEAVQLAAVRENGYVIQHIDNPSEAVQLAAVRENAEAVQYIANPSEDVKLAAVRQFGNAIRYIENPSEAIKLAAVKQDGRSIRFVENPSEVVQLAAVQQDANAIQYIENPSEAAKKAAWR